MESELLPLAFPKPEDLWEIYRNWKRLAPSQEKVVLQNYFEDAGGKEPRYYQCIAINKAIEAIAQGQDRVLLVMATGTGKTYTAFQIIWRLWKAGIKKRILYLADRNVLVDQTMVNDFRPFGKAMAKLSTAAKTIERVEGAEVPWPEGAEKKQRRIEYLDENGKLVTESLRDYSKKALRRCFASPDDFLKRWKEADRKQAIIMELENEGLLLDPLAEEVGKDLDPFDLICHVAFDQPALTRRERADTLRKRDFFTRYGEQARAVLEGLLQKYQDQGLTDLDDPRILKISPFDTLGTPIQLINSFGGRQGFEEAVHELQSALYEKAA